MNLYYVICEWLKLTNNLFQDFATSACLWMLPNFLINCLFSTSLNLLLVGLKNNLSSKFWPVQCSDLYELDSCCSLCIVGKESTFCVTLSTTVWYIPQHANSDNEPIQVINWLYTDWWPISSTHCICLVSYSEVPNKHAIFLILFEKKNPTSSFFHLHKRKKDVPFQLLISTFFHLYIIKKMFHLNDY